MQENVMSSSTLQQNESLPISNSENRLYYWNLLICDTAEAVQNEFYCGVIFAFVVIILRWIPKHVNGANGPSTFDV